MEELASNNNQMMHDRTVRKSIPEVLQMDAFNIISA